MGQSDWSRFPPKVRDTLEVLSELCGGEQYIKILSEGNAAIRVQVFSSDAFGIFEVEVSFDGWVRRV